MAALVGAGLYLSLGLTDQMFTDWIALNAVFGPAFGLFTAAILRRQPRNRAVWAVLCAAVLMSTQALSVGILQRRIAGTGTPSTLAELVPAELPLTAAIALQTASWVWIAATFAFALAVLVYPDGRLPGPRWRWVAWGTAGAMVVATSVAAWIARPGSRSRVMSESPLEGAPSALVTGFGLGLLALGLSLVAAACGLAARYRSSTGQVRLQIRWIAWAGALFAVQFVVLFPLQFTSVGVGPYRASLILSVLVFLVAYTRAVTRYRLYAIDRIISRTVSYGLVTAVLVAVYVGAVLGAQVLFAAPGAERSPTIVAGSTLLVAALFRPVRRRSQVVVDRRFNRRVHDAARTIEAFNGRLRGEVDLDALIEDLRGTAARAVEPTGAAVWVVPNR